MVLWTNEPLAAARHIYLAAGFSLVSEEPHHSFGVDLTGQVLPAGPGGRAFRHVAMTAAAGRAPSARQDELLELAYRYVLAHGLADMSLRPLAKAIGSSPRVLLFLYGSKDNLIRALLERARSDELAAVAAFGKQAARPT